MTTRFYEIIDAMTTDLFLRGKWTLKAHGRSIVVTKGHNEKTTHVLMKVFLWALYLPEYPDLSVEIRIGDRYKPDVVALDEQGLNPLFWGESGQVGQRKLISLFRRYPSTHFAISKWSSSLASHVSVIERALKGINRKAPVDLILFPEEGAEQFINEDGEIHLRFDDLSLKRFEG